MTESEWLACEDSQMMLSFAQGEDFHQHRLYPLSDRKLRLFACACCYGVSAELGKDAEQCTEWESGPAKNAANWATAWVGDQKQPTSAERANLLRDIVGNPFRPVALPCNTGCKMMTSGRGDKPHHCHTHHKDVEYVGHDKRTRFAVCPDSLEYFRWKYCTPTVLAIAQAAYEERPGRKCDGRCRDYTHPGKYPDDTNLRNPNWLACPDCNGTGRIDDGSLDPVTLSILADALEDAGCDNVDILRHLRGYERCDCESRYDAYTRGCDCGGNGWRSLRGPHVRGCWALDLILGKE